MWYQVNIETYTDIPLIIQEIESNVWTGMVSCFYVHLSANVVFISLLRYSMVIEPEITLEWAQKQFVMTVNTLFLFLSRHHEPINDYRNDDIDTSFPYLTRFVHVLLMTIDCALHNGTGDCHAVTWKVISNPLDISILFTATFITGRVNIRWYHFDVSPVVAFIKRLHVLVKQT